MTPHNKGFFGQKNNLQETLKSLLYFLLYACALKCPGQQVWVFGQGPETAVLDSEDM